MSARKLTPEQVEELLAMRERGLGYPIIARHFGITAGSVGYHCLMRGADPPKAGPIDKTIRGPLVVERNGRPVRRFTPEEDAQIVALSAEGLGKAEIGRRLGRTGNTIAARLATLARHDARAEAAPPSTRNPTNA